jgi:arabinofuranosyltransferase
VLLAGIGWWVVRHAHLYAAIGYDDAFITFRHSFNLVHGHGPVYNAGEHVEGTSSLLFAVLLAIPIALGVAPLAAAKFFGVAAFVAMAWIAYATVASVAPYGRRLLGLVAAIIVAATTPLAYFAQSGLETTLYACLLALGVLLLARGDRPPWPTRSGQPGRARAREPEAGRTRPEWVTAMGLVAMARPEGVFFFPIFLVLDAVRRLPQGRRAALHAVLRAAAVFALVFGPVLLFRLAFFHAWMPNTVTAKRGGLERFAEVHELSALWNVASTGNAPAMIKDHLGHLGLSAPLLLAGLSQRKTAFTTSVCLATGVSCALLVVWSDGDWMGHDRLLTPAMEPLAVAVALGLGALIYRSPPKRLAERFGALVPTALIGYLAADASCYESTYSWPHGENSAYLQWLGSTLQSVRRDGDVLATDMAGILPYYAEFETVDIFGLCDRHIAQHGTRSGPMGRLDMAYVIARRPTYYLFNFTSEIADLYRNPALADQTNDYWAVITPQYTKYTGADRKLLLVRRERPDLEGLTTALGATLVDPRDELRRLGQW